MADKVNMITPAYTKQLGFWAWKTDVRAYKIDCSSLKIYEMAIAAFQVMAKLDRAWLLQKTFLLANITMEIVLKILFFSFSNANIQYAEKEFT